MRFVLQLTVLALAFAITASFGTFAPTHEVSADPVIRDELHLDNESLPPSPCNPEGGPLTGTFDIKSVVHEHEGEFLTIRETGRGQFTDTTGLKYQFKANFSGTYTSPPDFNLPQSYSEKVRIISETGVDNWEARLVLNINEQGELEEAHISGSECRG